MGGMLDGGASIFSFSLNGAVMWRRGPSRVSFLLCLACEAELCPPMVPVPSTFFLCLIHTQQSEYLHHHHHLHRSDTQLAFTPSAPSRLARSVKLELLVFWEEPSEARLVAGVRPTRVLPGSPPVLTSLWGL